MVVSMLMPLPICPHSHKFAGRRWRWRFAQRVNRSLQRCRTDG